MDKEDRINRQDITAFIIRIVFWAITILVLAKIEKSAGPSLKGFVLGVIAGDIITWIIVTVLIELPKSFVAPSVDIVVNIVIVYLIMNVFGLEWPKDTDAQAVCFLALIGTAAIKLIGYFSCFISGND